MNATAKKLLIGVAVVAAVGFGVNAFADWGGGWGSRGWGGHMMEPGYHMRGWSGYGPGYGRGYAPESYEAMEREYQKFYKETEETRERLYEKRAALERELAMENPDADKATQIQKDISSLESKLDEQRIAHMIELRKNNPQAGSDNWGRGPMGYGPGGYCWR